MAKEKISESNVRKLLSNQDYDGISELLNNNTVNLSFHYTDILINAVVNNNIEIVQNLISKGADLNAKNECNFTPLLAAIKRGKVEIAQLLINNGVHINAEVRYSSYLIEAINSRQTEIAKTLIYQGADCNAVDDDNATVLIYAASNYLPEIVRILVDKKVNINAQDRFGQTALIVSIILLSSDICKILVDAGADITLKDKHGQTALDIAKKEGYTEIVQMLNESIVKNEKLVNNQQSNNIQLAQDKNNPSADNQQANSNNLLQPKVKLPDNPWQMRVSNQSEQQNLMQQLANNSQPSEARGTTTSTNHTRAVPAQPNPQQTSNSGTQPRTAQTTQQTSNPGTQPRTVQTTQQTSNSGTQPPTAQTTQQTSNSGTQPRTVQPTQQTSNSVAQAYANTYNNEQVKKTFQLVSKHFIDHKAEIDTLKVKDAEKNREIESLKQQLTEKNREIEELKNASKIQEEKTRILEEKNKIQEEKINEIIRNQVRMPEAAIVQTNENSLNFLSQVAELDYTSDNQRPKEKGNHSDRIDKQKRSRRNNSSENQR